MSKTEEKRPIWKKRWFLWAIILLLVLVSAGLGRLALSAHDRQNMLEQELELQKEAIAALRSEARQAEEDRLIQESEPVITSSTVSDQLSSLQELVTTEYIYTNAGKFENQNQIKIIGQDVGIPFTSTRCIVACDGRSRVGVDLSRAQIDVDEEARSIAVTLPDSEIVSHETFEDTLVVLDETNNVFNPISIENYTEFVAGQKTSMEQKAIDRGVLASASQEARTLVQSFLAQLPGMESYRLTVT